jgi:3'(2'), 5'-bisphosphate nucleotidase
VRTGFTPLTIVASRSHRTHDTDLYIRNFEAAEIVSVGSSLKFCMIASGEADLYPRFGIPMEWDTAAGDAVLRAAGGMTTTLDGRPLTYGKRGRAELADFVNPSFVAKGRVEERG